MATSTVLLVVLFAFAAQTLGEQAEAPQNLEEFLNKAKEETGKMWSHISQMMGLPESGKTEEVAETVKTKAVEFANDIQANLLKMQEEFKNNQHVQDAVKAFSDKVNEKMAEIKQSHPDAAHMEEKFKAGYESMVEEVKKFDAEMSKEGGVKDQAETFVKDMLSKASEHIKTMEKNIHDAVHTDH